MSRPRRTRSQPPAKQGAPARAAIRAGPSHVIGRGKAARSAMVDVSDKADTARLAHAQARVRFRKGVLAGLLRSGGPKGPILEVARTAGVLAAKRTSDWIPLTHTLRLDWVDVDFSTPRTDCLLIDCRASTTGPTGVEMEALVGAAAAALTIYDMTKSVDKGISIERLELVEKRGGKSGGWSRARRR